MPKASQVGEITYVDVQMIKPIGYKGVRYATFFLDDKTRMPKVAFHIHKDQASDACIKEAKWFHNVTGRYPVLFASDSGRGFSKFNKWAENKGILIRNSAPRTPEPNGAIEHLQYHAVQTARVMMIEAGLPHYLWPFAVETAVYIISRLIQKDATCSPIQAYQEELKLPNPAPSLKHIKVWGCRAYVHIPKEDRIKSMKMNPFAKIESLIEYLGDHGHLYKIWYPDSNKITISRDVTF